MLTPSPIAETSINYVVELTPVGRGAVAVVLVAGPDAVRAVGKRFAPAGQRPLADAAVGRILFGRWGTGGEELVVCRRTEDRVEIHCHGGVAAVQAVVDGLLADGCRSMPWQDWVRSEPPRGRVRRGGREFESRRDSSTCAAQIALADAVTARTAAILLDQLNGAIAAAIRAAIAAVAGADWSWAAELIRELLDRHDLGLHLTAPWRVVFAGAPNVGKSSLINALAGYERAIVSPVPGTTRDVVTVTTAIDGWPVLLADTAGLRATGDELESAGVELTQAALAGADLAILVHDATSPVVDGGRCPPYGVSRIIHVLNKIDLFSGAAGVGACGELSRADDPARCTAISVSALTGEGIGELAAAIGKSLAPNPPASGAAVPFTLEQFESLVVARSAIERRHASAASEALQSLLAAEGSGFGVQG